MKKLLTTTAVVLVLVACDAPTEPRIDQPPAYSPFLAADHSQEWSAQQTVEGGMLIAYAPSRPGVERHVVGVKEREDAREERRRRAKARAEARKRKEPRVDYDSVKQTARKQGWTCDDMRRLYAQLGPTIDTADEVNSAALIGTVMHTLNCKETGGTN